jgi:outer membrane protein OmpA-like peptidoglycan-associated protein
VQQPPSPLQTPALAPGQTSFDARWPVLYGFAQDPAEDRMQKDLPNVGEELEARCEVPAVYFDFDSAEPSSDARAELARVASCYRHGPLRDRRLRLIGRADLTGDAAYNLALGMRRADSVKRVLVQAGVPAPRIQTSSRGTRALLGPFDGYTYRDDRRVDIVVTP